MAAAGWDDVPTPLKRFRMLATSLQVTNEPMDAFFGLLSSWKEQDLFSLGKLVYGFDENEIARRYFYSGGSVRDFGIDSVEDIAATVDDAVSSVLESDELFSSSLIVRSDPRQVDRLRRTFIRTSSLGTELEVEQSEEASSPGAAAEEEKREGNTLDSTGLLRKRGVDFEVKAERKACLLLRKRGEWEQDVDSAYAVRKLTENFSENKLLQTYHWAIGAGYRSLAGELYEIYMHRAASNNKLELIISKYYMRKFRQPDQAAAYHFMPLTIQRGTSTRSVTDPTNYDTLLRKWKAATSSTYWSPECENFHNIDSIAKINRIGDASVESEVAYFQITIAKKHAIDGKKLADLNTIFHPNADDKGGRPMYIAVCTDEEACKKFVLGTRAEVVQAEEACQLFVGYMKTPVTKTGSSNDIPPREDRPPSPYHTRSKSAAEQSASGQSSGQKRPPADEQHSPREQSKRRKGDTKKASDALPPAAEDIILPVSGGGRSGAGEDRDPQVAEASGPQNAQLTGATGPGAVGGRSRYAPAEDRGSDQGRTTLPKHFSFEF